MGHLQVLPLHVKVDLGVMAMKGYLTLPRYQKQEPFHQIQFNAKTTFHMQSYPALLDDFDKTKYFHQIILTSTEI